MASTKIKLDSAGIGAVLAGGKVTAMVTGAGDDVGGRVDATVGGEAIPVEVTPYRANVGQGPARAAVAVTMVHPAAMRVEAKRGSLIRAASAAGLEVTAR